MPPKRTAAKRARTPEPDQPATRPPIAGASADSKIPSASDVTAALARRPKQPMMALWDVLTDLNSEGPELAMAIVRHKSCGLERKTGPKDGVIEIPDVWKLDKGATPLLMALFMSRPDVAQALLVAGADVFAVTSTNETALHFAALHDNLPFIETLLGLRFAVDSAGSVGQTALHCAASNGSLKALSHLISKGANVNAKCGQITPLMLAAMNGHTKVVEILISNRAEVNAKDEDGWTALHSAAYNGHTEVIKVLCANGADAIAKENGGGTPLQFASNNGVSEKAIKILVAHSDAVTLKKVE